MKQVPIDKVIKILNHEVKKYNAPVMELVKIQTKNPFKILVATILSARTKDNVTALVVKKLFNKVKSFNDLDKIKLGELQKLVYPVGFYKTKAKLLKKLPIVLKKEFNGKIPEEVNELIKLPGVGRKTANLVVAVAFNKPAICVDTHVHKIMNRLGYVKTKTPIQTEKVLREKLPVKYWIKINSVFVAFGQNICVPVSPYCSKCPVFEYCNRMSVKSSR